MAHSHDHTQTRNEKRLLIALVLTGGFMLAEAVGGWLAGSLALMADAAHMFVDAAALALAWGAAHMAGRPADSRRSYGYQRFQVIAALINGVFLIGLVAWIVVEAADRIISPVAVDAPLMLGIAVLGLIVNLAVYAILHSGARNINMEGALLHVMGDLLGSVAAIIAAVLILLYDLRIADPLLSLLVAGLILRSAVALVRKAAHILMEGTPEGLDIDELKATLVREIPEVEDAHHLHVWLLTSEHPLLTIHIRVKDIRHAETLLPRIKDLLRREYGIGHSTIQIETEACADHS